MVGHTEPPRMTNTLVESRERALVDQASLKVSNAPTALADEMVVMPGELLIQLVSPATPNRVGGPKQPDAREEVDGPVDRDDIDPLQPDALMNLGDRQRERALGERVEHRASRASNPNTTTRQRVRNADTPVPCPSAHCK